MGVVEWLAELGGVATYATLTRLTSRAQVARALAGGDIVRDAHGRYALPHAEEAVRAAHALSGVLSHASAALAWGWEVKTVPDRPHVTVPVKRKVPANRPPVHLHRRDLTSDEVVGHLTSRALTLEQCLRVLPFDEALAVADSALRHGLAPSMLAATARARGPGSAGIRRVASEADGLAANPFESVLRAISLSVPGLRLRPQVRIGHGHRPDLVDADLGIVVEADSFAWHGSRAALRRDARRYDLMVVDGWIVLRFAWEDVMHDPEHVRSILLAAVALRRSQGPTRPDLAA